MGKTSVCYTSSWRTSTHGRTRSFAKEMQVPKTLLIENGDIIKMLPGNKPEIIDKAPSGKVYLDGNINVETDSQSIKDRKNLSVKWIFRNYFNCFK